MVRLAQCSETRAEGELSHEMTWLLGPVAEEWESFRAKYPGKLIIRHVKIQVKA